MLEKLCDTFWELCDLQTFCRRFVLGFKKRLIELENIHFKLYILLAFKSKKVRIQTLRADYQLELQIHEACERILMMSWGMGCPPFSLGCSACHLIFFFEALLMLLGGMRLLFNHTAI
jgi:hypothetical protein